MAETSNRSILSFPVQSISDTKKNTKWFEECVEAAESLYTFDNSINKSSWYNKIVNQNLRNNILTTSDVENYLNPSGIKISTSPEKMAHQGLANAKIMLLKGEEARRLQRYEFKAFLTNNSSDGVSSKEELLKERWMQKINQILSNPELTEEQIQNELQKYQKYLKHSVQDNKEIVANKILRYEYERLDLANKFTNSYEKLLTFGEEIMCIESYGNEVYAREVNPLNIFALQSPESPFLEDSDVIVEWNYMNIGNVRKLYYDELDEEEVKKLESGYDNYTARGGIQPTFTRFISISQEYAGVPTDLNLGLNNPSSGFNTGAYNAYGDIRVLRVCWRSSRKIGKLKYYNELGVPVSTIVDEFYKIDKSKGETVEWIWVNEWLEGTKLGEDIFVRLRPIPYQGRSLSNLSECTPPYVGVISNFNQSKVMSLFDYMKPTDYLYDIVHYRMLLAMSKYKGPLEVLNVSMIPSSMSPEQWFNFIDNTNKILLDPTREILKGQNAGKSAGVFNTVTAQALNNNMGSYIADHTNMLMFLESQLDKLSGINNARQGVLDGKENVGTANMAWTASNSMTEPYNQLHNLFKKKVMRKLLNVAQYVWSINPVKAQYVLNDFQAEIVSYFDDISDSDFDIHISNSSQIDEVTRAIKDLVQPLAQNGSISMSQVAHMYLKDSVAETLNYLEDLEEQAQLKAQQAQQAEYENEQALKQAEMEVAQAELELEYEKLDREDLNKQLDRENKIYLEEIKALGFAKDTDINQNMIPDVVETSKLALERSKLTFDQINKNTEQQFKSRELALKELDLKHKEKVEELKIKAIDQQSKNQELMQNKELKFKEKELKVKERLERLKARSKAKSSSKK